MESLLNAGTDVLSSQEIGMLLRSNGVKRKTHE
jgi:hypothetical protein